MFILKFLYLGSVVCLMSNAPGIVIRSALSKVTPPDELGRIFSLVGALEACVPLISAPIMTKVYNCTLDVFPGAILLISALLYLFITIILSIVYILARKIPQLEEEEEHAGIITNEMTLSDDNQ